VKIKCQGCGTIVNKRKDVFERNVNNLKIDPEDYLKIYYCRVCRRNKLRSSSPSWYMISQIQNLPLWFIEKYKDRVNWYAISWIQKLPLEFIEKYKDRVYWRAISGYQALTEEFILKHIDKITSDILYNPCYQDLPDTIKLLLKAKFGC